MAVQLQKVAEKVGLSGISPLAAPSPLQSPAQQVASSSPSGFTKSFRELPARYRRKPLDQTEIEYIQVCYLLFADVLQRFQFGIYLPVRYKSYKKLIRR